jgi:threonine/homoserine/homoserine lactone efflux protein
MPVGAFIVFVLAASFSPGPNNITAMNNARKVGFLKNFPFVLGVCSGFFVVLLSSAFFNLALDKIVPGVQPFLGTIGALYMLYLAFKPFFPTKKKNLSDLVGKRLLAAGFLLQFLNAKGILYGLATMSGFVLPYYSDVPSLAVISLGMASVASLSVACWSLFGTVFQKYFSEYEFAVNVTMAVLLVYCAIIISGLDSALSKIFAS